MTRYNTDYYVGIDCGAVSINCVVVDEEGEIVHEYPYQRHMGNVEEKTALLIEELYRDFGEENIRCISFTGNHGKNLSDRLGVFYEFETISQVLGSMLVWPQVRTIISMGGQDTALLQVRYIRDDKNPGEEYRWELQDFNTNGPCASGTGAFIDQQAQRLATSIYSAEVDNSQEEIDRILKDFVELGQRSQEPANVACRCTVFTKSDMIHLQNKGERLEDIIYGLHVGNARNYMSTIISNRTVEEDIIFVGGLSLNALQVKAFRQYYPALIVPPYSTSVGALGVALQAREQGKSGRVDPKMISSEESGREGSIPVASKLTLEKTRFSGSGRPFPISRENRQEVFLGVDIGSTTTKYAVMTPDRKIIHKDYVPTQGKPIEVTQRLLKGLRDEMGKILDISGTATTGSGRNVVGDFLNVDLIIDEITAHARGAVEIDPEVDTIFEIGGQDSKYIYLSNGYPLDFDMNKVCAAGTGSFLHELANKYGINIVGEFEEIALASESPVRLAERCTVFMESDLVSYHQKGVNRKDLMAGLCYAIVYNYLNRVVEKRKVGKRVMFLGGPSLNKAVVAAFEKVLGRKVVVPEHREVLGAYGAAISAQERMGREGVSSSSFRGMENAINDTMEYKEKICRADPNCNNQCKLKIYNFDGRKSVWGGECGRYDVARGVSAKKQNFFKLRKELWQAYMNGLYREFKGEPLPEVDGRPTVGMQKALYTHQTGVLWAHFFDLLGYRLVLTKDTDLHISDTGIETMVAETCYPIKVSHGHVKELAGNTRYLFLPSMITMPTVKEAEVGYYCPLVQSNSYMVRAALDLDEKSILTPTLHLKYDPDTLAVELSEQLAPELGVSGKKIKEAVQYSLQKFNEFRAELFRRGREFLETRDMNEPLVVVTGRPYNLYDERLNLRLGENLSKIGVEAIPMDFIDVSSVDLSDFPSMYWGLGAQILRTAKFVKASPTMFGLHLTNFGCGADSFVEHFYRHVMGDKPYLILELDEHSAVAGAMTRLEAYKNVIDNAVLKSIKNAEIKEGVAAVS